MTRTGGEENDCRVSGPCRRMWSRISEMGRVSGRGSFHCSDGLALRRSGGCGGAVRVRSLRVFHELIVADVAAAGMEYLFTRLIQTGNIKLHNTD